MKVVLLKDIPKLGRKYEVKEVSDGHGRNFLIRRGLAELATAKSLKMADDFKKRQLDAKRMDDAGIDAFLAKISTVKLTMKQKANDGGILFAGIKIEDIAKAMRDQGHLVVPVEYIQMDKAVKTLGEHEVDVVAGNKKARFKLVVEKE